MLKKAQEFDWNIAITMLLVISFSGWLVARSIVPSAIKPLTRPGTSSHTNAPIEATERGEPSLPTTTADKT
jgi:hypothetical protein